MPRELVDAAQRSGPPAARQHAIVTGTEEAAAEYAGELSGIATVVVEPRSASPTSAAFSVSGYPTIYILDERGRIEAGGGNVRQITPIVPA